MAKGQQRSNREAKKPKQTKKAVVPAAKVVVTRATAATPVLGKTR